MGKTIAWERVPVAAYVFFSLFVAVSIFHLISCYLEKESLRRWSKPFCLFFLTVAVVVALPTRWPIYIGLLCGLVGDVLLIFKKKKLPFVIGAFFFFLNHGFFVAEYIIRCAGKLPIGWVFYMASGIYFILFSGIFFTLARKVVKNKKLAIAGVSYFALLTLDLIWAIISSSSGNFAFHFLGIIGGMSFLVSDIILSCTLFIKDVKRRDFFIMITYLLAQALIAIGMGLSYFIA